jgi:hypothetical protein
MPLNSLATLTNVDIYLIEACIEQIILPSLTCMHEGDLQKQKCKNDLQLVFLSHSCGLHGKKCHHCQRLCLSIGGSQLFSKFGQKHVDFYTLREARNLSQTSKSIITCNKAHISSLQGWLVTCDRRVGHISTVVANLIDLI